jgi:hypothetical protein
MNVHKPVQDTSDHDAVMSWLQDRELKDRPLADARSGRGGLAVISFAIGRLQAKAYTAFPHVARSVIDAFVHQYVDPLGHARAGHWEALPG